MRTLRNSSLLIIVLFLLSLVAQDVYAMPPVKKAVLSNGLVLLQSEDHSLPFFNLKVLIDGGARRDPSDQEGLARLAAGGILLGTAKHSAEAINQELDFMGASLGSSSGRDYSTMGLRALRKDMDKALDLFMEVLTEPAFPDEEIKREVEKTLAAIQAEEDQPGDVAEREFQKALFLTGPYGHPAIGTKDSVQKIKREAIVDFYKAYYHPNNYIVVVAGDITAEEVRTKLVPRLERMGSVEIPKETLASDFAKGPEMRKVNREITQANIIIGNAGISRDNPDFYAVTVMNYILGGGGFASRLTEEIRNKRGLAYSVASFFDVGKYPGSFQMVLQTKNSSASEAISLARLQMELIRKELVSDQELEGAKKYLVGSFPMRIDTQAKISDFLLQVQYYGLGLDYPEKYPSLINSVTKEDVLRVAKKYLHPENSILVMVADLEKAKLDKP